MTTYYHVAGKDYLEGETLLPFDELQRLGIAPDWKWDKSEADTDVVCVFESLEEARLFKADFAPEGQILKIKVSPADINDPITWETEYGTYITPRLTQVEEGYTAFVGGIPDEWIVAVE